MTDIDTKEELRQQCLAIAKFLRQEHFGKNEDGEDYTVYDYLQDVYDIRFVINANRDYLGARVLVAGGGPNIWINTVRNHIEGYWGTDEVSIYYQQDNLGLDDALEEQAISFFNLKR